MNTVILLDRQAIKDGYHVFCAFLRAEYYGNNGHTLVISEWKTNDKATYRESLLYGMPSDVISIVETAYRWYDQWIADNGFKNQLKMNIT